MRRFVFSRAMLFGAVLSVAAPARAAVSLDTAKQLLDEWQLEDALAAAQELLGAGPSNPDNLLLAARVQYARGEHLSALSLAQGAHDAGHPDAKMLVPMLEHVARYATHFQTLETKHFKIRYLNKDEIVAAYTAPVLEAAYTNVGADLDFLAAERGEKIAVEIFPDARGLAGATGLSLKEIENTGTIAVCKFHRLMMTSPLATSNGFAWADTIAHEFVHLVISKKSRNTVPIWLHEGIAKYYESRWKGRAGESLGAYSENLLAEAVRKGAFIAFKDMHPSMAKLPSQKDAALAFAEVFTVIEFLLDKHGERSIAQLLKLASQGVSINEGLQKTFGMRLAEIEAAWKKVVVRRQFKVVPGAKPTHIELSGTESESQREKPLEAMKEKEAHEFSRLGELLQLRGHHGPAIVEYEKARKIAGNRYPTLLTRLAGAYTEVGRHEDALSLLRTAAETFPEDADMHVRAGRLALAKNQLEEARKHFEIVRLQNPFNPELHAFFANYYEQTGKAEEAAKAKRFLALASRPREQRRFELPRARQGSAKLNIVTSPWAKIELDGKESVPSPAWGLVVTAGDHVVRFARPGGAAVEQKVSVSEGEAKLVLLR